MKSKLLIALMGIFCLAAAAADVTGKWVAQVPGRGGNTQETTFNLKTDGSKLTGNVVTPRGETAITDGTVSGNDITFTVVRNVNGNEMKMMYTGKVSGNEIKFSRKVGENTQE